MEGSRPSKHRPDANSAAAMPEAEAQPLASSPWAPRGTRPVAPRWRLRLAQTATWLVATYLLCLAALWWWQEEVLFLPDPLPANHRFALGPDVHEGWVEVPGARLNTLHLRLPQPSGVVFFLHGNAGNLSSWFVNVDFYRQLNVDLVMIDYRGYGKSTGRIANQAQLIADVRAAWQAVEPRYRGLKRIVYGRSLGTGLAAELAATIQPELTVLVSPYESMRSLAAQLYPWVPGAALRYPLPTHEWLPQVRGPVLLVHGQADSLIPASHSQGLQALVPHAELMLLPGVGHGDVQRSAPYRAGLARAIASVTTASQMQERTADEPAL
jgi:pimeloyl-ACP methyl ester carboxylesterase